MMIVSQFVIPLTLLSHDPMVFSNQLTLPSKQSRFYIEYQEQPRFKDTMHHNYMTTEDLIKEIITNINSIPLR